MFRVWGPVDVERYLGCVPPRSFSVGPTLSTLKSRNVEVLWRWTGDTPRCTLNLQSGRWENEDDGSEPTEEVFQRAFSRLAELRTGWTNKTYRETLYCLKLRYRSVNNYTGANEVKIGLGQFEKTLRFKQRQERERVKGDREGLR
ncbi:hypothetical protein HOLleu_42421 [Holothuria leucospilota]|uniref:Uncharacterized protein n=1 Tax=Holothuria leucospilota TaxID=206669 RepID=A0A9Q1BBM2_HOLLE|nr:hypothetical protein HOLleu_42421 [Holothuria leucospilota]